MDWTAASGFAAAVSAGAAAIAAGANWLQSRHAARANSVTVYLEMMKEYTSPEMRTAISDLATFWERLERGQSVADAYRDLSTHKPERAAELRGMSRMASYYFVNAAKLFEAKMIDEALLKLLVTQSGLNVFYDVAVPINLVRNPNDNSSRYAQLLKTVVPVHGSGLYKRNGS